MTFLQKNEKSVELKKQLYAFEATIANIWILTALYCAYQVIGPASLTKILVTGDRDL